MKRPDFLNGGSQGKAMNCKAVRYYLLGSEKPARPTGAAAAHLADCPACREWQRQLIRMEGLVPFLPVPPSTGQAELLHEVLEGPAFEVIKRRSPILHLHEAGWQRKERGRSKVAVAFALAAGLLFFAFGWWAWQQSVKDPVAVGPKPSEVETLAVRLKAYDASWGEDIEKASTPRERVLALAKAADGLHGLVEKQTQNGTATGLAKLAKLYEDLVRLELLPRAGELSAEDRPQVLPGIADQLRNVESLANRLANTAPVDSKESLKQIAAAAHEGESQLRRLLRGEAA
jgi:hypothetical protein